MRRVGEMISTLNDDEEIWPDDENGSSLNPIVDEVESLNPNRQDELIDIFFFSIMPRLFEGEGALAREDIERLLRVGLPINDPVRPESEDSILREQSSKAAGRVGGHPSAATFGLDARPRQTLVMGRYGGSAYLCYDGSVVAGWAESRSDVDVDGSILYGVAIMVNGQKAWLPYSTWESINARIKAQFENRLSEGVDDWMF